MKLVVLSLLGLLLAQGTQAGEILRLKATGSLKPTATLLQAGKDTGLYLVQWKEAIAESEKAALRALGLELLQYLPDDAFLVQGGLNAAEKAAGLSFVRVVLPYEAGMKVEPELTRNGLFSFQDLVRVTVQTAPGASLGDIEGQLLNPVNVGEGILVGETTVGQVWKLAARKDVVWLERYLPMRSMEMEVGAAAEPAETTTGFESGTKVMKADAAWGVGLTGQGQLVAFADTGLDSGNLSSLIPDFQGQVKSGWAMGLGGSSWGDPMNHGTHVAGSIAGSGASSNGLVRGTAFGAKLVAEGMWSDIMNNIMPPPIPKLFAKAYEEGARIHSNSWGAPNSNGRYDSWASLADKYSFEHPDFLPIFAAGNDGADKNKDGVIDEGSVSSPGSAKNVLTVGASKNFLLEGGIQRKMADLRDGKNKWGVEPIASSMLSEDARGMAAFSSRGPTADGRLKPEVVAPGTNIVAARSRHPKAKPQDSWGQYGEHYLYMGGTSMATPLTAGAMALVRQSLLQEHANPSAALMKAVVANTAEDLFPGQFGQRARGQEQPSPRPNNHQGWGRVDLEALVSEKAIWIADDNTQGLRTGDDATTMVEVSESKPLRITLAYTDAPASANATKTLVNDLDLSVLTPDGTVLHPQGRATKDSTNNMEQIDIENPLPGTYLVRVNGANVPQGKNGAQPYALVISSR